MTKLVGLDRPEGYNCDTVLSQSEIPSINQEEKEKKLQKINWMQMMEILSLNQSRGSRTKY